MLVVRFNGTSAPALVLAKPNEDGTAGPELSRPDLKKSATAGVYETRAVLDRPVSVIASNDGEALAQWHITIIPDEPPAISSAGDVKVTPTGGFSVPWTASDDYGVAGIKAHFALACADSERRPQGPHIRSAHRRCQPAAPQPQGRQGQGLFRFHRASRAASRSASRSRHATRPGRSRRASPSPSSCPSVSSPSRWRGL